MALQVRRVITGHDASGKAIVRIEARRPGPGGGMIGSIVVAFVGPVILVGITRLLKTP